MTAAWDCDAYGPEGAAMGALCFFGGDGVRLCSDQQECRDNMTLQRQRIFNAIQAHAALGDPVAIFLAGEFSDPSELLGGGA